MRKLRLRATYAVLFVLLSAGVYLAITKLFAIREIAVVGGNIQVSVDERRLPGTLLFFPTETLRAEILRDNPILADLRFEKKYPHTLVIVPIVRSATALLIAPTRRVFVDARGIVLADADASPAGLPQITAPVSGLRIGQQVKDGPLKTSLDFLVGTGPLLHIDTITVSGDGAIKAHTGNLDILFTQGADLTRILTTLQTLLTGFRIKGTLPTVIDLRFDKPVVTF